MAEIVSNRSFDRLNSDALPPMPCFTNQYHRRLIVDFIKFTKLFCIECSRYFHRLILMLAQKIIHYTYCMSYAKLLEDDFQECYN